MMDLRSGTQKISKHDVANGLQKGHIVKEYTDAFRKNKLKVGLYYSISGTVVGTKVQRGPSGCDQGANEGAIGWQIWNNRLALAGWLGLAKRVLGNPISRD